MTAALSANQRDRLEALVSRARRILEEDLSTRVAGRFGIDPDGTVANPDDLRLDSSGLAAWRELVEVVTYLNGEGLSAGDAASRLVREAVFTHLNRLVAIRIAEALDLLPVSLMDGRRSQGLRNVLELAPLLAADNTGGYWTYLQLCGDELAADVPSLFDPRNPLLALAPSPGALDDLVGLLSDPANHELWTAPDCLGWVYQFFNRKEERDAMREASTAPRTSRELAVRNQFFTPRYVVDFLVQNTLGRRLIESDPASRLAGELTLLVDPPQRPGPPVDLDDIAILDPAAGSGHFLLGAYDVLERGWQLAGVSPAAAAPRIVRSLWGVDIDVRAAQVAAAAVMFRARRHCRDVSLPRPNVVTARALPAFAEKFTGEAELTETQRRTLDAIGTIMARAPELGSLLKVEAEMEAEIRNAGFGRVTGRGGQGTLLLTDEAFAEEEAGLLAALQHLADQTTSSAAERLFAAEANDALLFVEAMHRRYDAVLMNPPFGEPIPSTKPYLRAAFPWSPSRLDLLAAFVGRGLELCKPDGYVGAITSRAGLFLTTFQEWRKQVLLGNRLTALADLGYRVMAQAKVEAAAYVVRKDAPSLEDEATFIRLLKDRDKASALVEAIGRQRAHQPDGRVYRLRLVELHQVPGSPLAYSMSPTIRRLFAELPMVAAQAEVRQGLATADDGRFVRAIWEVDPRRLARSRDETHSGGRWVPFAKGGDYGPYWADIHLVVDWECDGERLRAFDGAVVRNPQYYFQPGLTWVLRTESALSVRVLPAGCVVSNKGNVIVSEQALPLLAWLNSRYVRLLIDTTAAGGDEDKTDVSRSYEVGTIRSLPDPTGLDTSVCDQLAKLAEAAARVGAATDELDETTRRFVAPAVLQYVGSSLRERASTAVRLALEHAITVVEAHDAADELLRSIIDPDGTADKALYDSDGPLVTGLPDGAADPALLARPLAHVVAETTARCGIARWIGLQHHVADRRLELAAVAEGRSPKALLDALPPDFLPPEEPDWTADDLVSYLMGVALGRWDVRIGHNPGAAPPRPDLFDPVSVCPPGMLRGDDGFPPQDTPRGYPIELPPGRVLLDELGHRWDVEAAVSRAARELFDDPASVLQELATILGRDLRTHLRRQFFRSHVVRYSKSKRKAPIYWPLYLPSGAWGVWAYAPMLSRETLFAVSRSAAGRLGGAEAEIRRLQRERDAGGAGRSPREVSNALAAEEQLVEELRRFREEAERVAGLGWEPDLDDGIILCAAPLAGLFPAWRDAAIARDELRAGKYPWATVSKWADQL